jgi:predicted metal-binding membrane protein
MIAPRVHDFRPFLAVFASLIVLAWVALLAWNVSPYGKYLDHNELGGNATLNLDYVRLAVLFVAGWTLMTVAMMLPTVIPLLLLFRQITRNRSDAGQLIACVISGYLSIWVAVGAIAHLGDLGLHAAIEGSRWLAPRSWIVGPLILLVAGAYQFTPLKRMCLDKCRSPYSFIVETWHGHTPKLEALWLGLRHGLFCVGCCWSLMLVMFAIGAGSVLWMLAIAPLMAAEKNLPWGKRLTVPVGVALLATGLAVIAAKQ